MICGMPGPVSDPNGDMDVFGQLDQYGINQGVHVDNVTV